MTHASRSDRRADQSIVELTGEPIISTSKPPLCITLPVTGAPVLESCVIQSFFVNYKSLAWRASSACVRQSHKLAWLAARVCGCHETRVRSCSHEPRGSAAGCHPAPGFCNSECDGWSRERWHSRASRRTSRAVCTAERSESRSRMRESLSEEPVEKRGTGRGPGGASRA